MDSKSTKHKSQLHKTDSNKNSVELRRSQSPHRSHDNSNKNQHSESNKDCTVDNHRNSDSTSNKVKKSHKSKSHGDISDAGNKNSHPHEEQSQSKKSDFHSNHTIEERNGNNGDSTKELDTSSVSPSPSKKPKLSSNSKTENDAPKKNSGSHKMPTFKFSNVAKCHSHIVGKAFGPSLRISEDTTVKYKGKEDLDNLLPNFFDFCTEGDMSFLQPYQALKAAGIHVVNPPIRSSSPPNSFNVLVESNNRNTEEVEKKYEKLREDLYKLGAYEEENSSDSSSSENNQKSEKKTPLSEAELLRLLCEDEDGNADVTEISNSAVNTAEPLPLSSSLVKVTESKESGKEDTDNNQMLASEKSPADPDPTQNLNSDIPQTINDNISNSSNEKVIEIESHPNLQTIPRVEEYYKEGKTNEEKSLPTKALGAEVMADKSSIWKSPVVDSDSAVIKETNTILKNSDSNYLVHMLTSPSNQSCGIGDKASAIQSKEKLDSSKTLIVVDSEMTSSKVVVPQVENQGGTEINNRTSVDREFDYELMEEVINSDRLSTKAFDDATVDSAIIDAHVSQIDSEILPEVEISTDLLDDMDISVEILDAVSGDDFDFDVKEGETSDLDISKVLIQDVKSLKSEPATTTSKENAMASVDEQQNQEKLTETNSSTVEDQKRLVEEQLFETLRRKFGCKDFTVHIEAPTETMLAQVTNPNPIVPHNPIIILPQSASPASTVSTVPLPRRAMKISKNRQIAKLQEADGTSPEPMKKRGRGRPPSKTKSTSISPSKSAKEEESSSSETINNETESTVSQDSAASSFDGGAKVYRQLKSLSFEWGTWGKGFKGEKGHPLALSLSRRKAAVACEQNRVANKTPPRKRKNSKKADDTDDSPVKERETKRGRKTSLKKKGKKSFESEEVKSDEEAQDENEEEENVKQSEENLNISAAAKTGDVEISKEETKKEDEVVIIDDDDDDDDDEVKIIDEIPCSSSSIPKPSLPIARVRSISVSSSSSDEYIPLKVAVNRKT